MPRIVDHDIRRAEVIGIASELVASGGLDALTVRDVARAAGYSTAIVSHYFADKQDLLLKVYQAAVARAQTRLDLALAQDAGDIVACLDALLPIDRARYRDWQIWFAFWGMAIADAHFASEQRRRVQDAIQMVRAVFQARAASGRLPATADCARLAETCVTLINGLAVQVLFDRKAWPAARQRGFILGALGFSEPGLS